MRPTLELVREGRESATQRSARHEQAWSGRCFPFYRQSLSNMFEVGRRLANERLTSLKEPDLTFVIERMAAAEDSVRACFYVCQLNVNLICACPVRLLVAQRNSIFQPVKHVASCQPGKEVVLFGCSFCDR